ncbi:hypothetical protein HMPREF1494_1192 [Bifidobacterium sp. MSTE12]|nr:hypothetical protein HMPREF1494_1192 [Bifidobacterium sp. MSTE12]
MKYRVGRGIRRDGESLSSRRAWIEINTPYDARISLPVALLTESVD